jgi:hypothetical protein
MVLVRTARLDRLPFQRFLVGTRFFARKICGGRRVKARSAHASPRVRVRCSGAQPVTGYTKVYRRLHDAVIRVYDAAGNVTDTHEHAGDFKEQ